ncbi:hypothetical protein MPF19_11555 [Polaribacter sp. Z014]|nr:hypothetical protein [Polaribacter sp. Z014]
MISLLSVIVLQIRINVNKNIDEKSILKKMDKVKNLFPNLTIKELDSFIINTKENPSDKKET